MGVGVRLACEGGWLGVELGVTVADRLEVAVALGVVPSVGCRVAVEVGLNVEVGVAVLLGVGVRVGVLEFVGIRLGVAVSVATGWLPIRTTIWNGAPRFPLTSRTRPVRMVSPGGKVLSALMTAQNCTRCAAEETKAGESNASTVQARLGLVLAWKAQLKSFNAFATDCVMLKSGGSKPGMPPAVHTPGSPSPSGREASICRSGRAVGSLEFQLNSTVPTAAPSLPGTASRTS